MGLRFALACSLALAALGTLAPGAAAHAFLVSTEPAQGARLESPPQALRLQFSEPATREDTRVSLRRPGEEEQPVGAIGRGDRGTQVRVPTPGLDDGVYVVSWQALSAIDGHGSSGEFAFAVGNPTAAIPAPSRGEARDWAAIAAAWAFLAGLAVAAGGAAVRFLPGAPERPTGWLVQAGAGAALAGAGAVWLANPPGSAIGVGLSAAAFVALGGALLAEAAARPRLVLALLLGGAAAWAGRSHLAREEGVAGGALDLLHLASGALWVGALLVIVLSLWQSRETTERGHLVRSYSRLAPGLVAVLVAAGAASALLLVPSWADLLESGYGQLILAKSGLLALALLLALAARRVARRSTRLRPLRHLAGLELLVLSTVLALAGVLANAAPPEQAAKTLAERSLGPAPISGPTARDAGLAGALTVYVTAGRGRLQIDVLGPADTGEKATLSLEARGPGGGSEELHPRPCGPGCFTQEYRPATGRTRLTIEAGAPDAVGGAFEADLRWPPRRTRVERLERVIERMRDVARLRLRETVSSGAGRTGGTTTTELSGAELIAAEPYAGGNVTDLRPIAGEPRGLRLFLPGSRIYYEMRLDERGRIASSYVVSPGHRITRSFSYPDG